MNVAGNGEWCAEGEAIHVCGDREGLEVGETECVTDRQPHTTS